MQMIRRFINLNKRLCSSLETLLPQESGKSIYPKLVEDIKPGDAIADIGGGKKPARILLGFGGKEDYRLYDGFDIDMDELDQARDLYTNVYQLDITKDVGAFRGVYDKVICKSTLEHVLDEDAAMRGLASLLKDGGELYIMVPYRYACFAVLNRLLPNEFKKRLLHYLFPNKIGDGFPAYYLNCTASSMRESAEKAGLQFDGLNKFYFSTYFTFFFPFYLVWRLITGVQYLVDRDYCERFEILFRKDPIAASGSVQGLA